MLTVYGICQCDTCRKALKWLEAGDLPHRFHDLRVDGLDREQVRRWLDSGFAAQLVNRRSTTWRGLDDTQKAATGTALEDLLLAHPTLVKRPLFERDGQVLAVGFKTAELEAVL
ncbi:Spx/MgsR family RNA polymerase-binding regulatory protein [Marinihelvus fidelis]|uniref:Spx/MgsR family RNA polymerase-binding regulatory protein n=1 Tax=Marinihelvus fidelis TaxID=2613842 RepID=A0A5N0TGG3_9GAMM|nr:Spx/MgsR family RNA polymerase-binding regulatory protein [Marinihelvus fidelis]KAA9133558.1 Spx/MgsR family RNA polymerase-binding regulatory protein [Marinihelvus fidelis]